ncbi:MAG: DUF2905 domain-containing protein [Chlamydiae bacterium]|nr:DUF2905 domain-containing protein [Chlamydiota bacterium]
MLRYLLITTVFLVIGGLFLHYDMEMPYVSNWLGKLPGDLIFKKDTILYYFPIASAGIVGLVVYLFLSLFKKTKK